VSDGEDVVTLWQVEARGKAIPFDRRANVGLHHLALAVVDQTRNSDYQGVVEYCGTIRG